MTTRLPLLVLGLSALTACAGVPKEEGPPVASAMDRHRIEVAQTNARLDVGVREGAMSLGAEDRGAIATFARAYNATGHGALILSAPSGGANADSAALLAQQTRLALVDAGVSYAAIAGSTYDAAGANDAPIVLTYARYEAFAPECAPLWEQDLAHQSNNQPWASFGCATQANLAAMIEDPRDLIQPREETPRDSDRRDVVFGHYREGETTASTRTQDERVAISNAVN